MPNFNGLWTSRQQMQARGGNTWPSVPGAPTSPVATAGNASASVAFTAPADTGFPANAITGYRVTSTPGGFTGTGLTSPVTVSGLTNGTAYTFTVAAQNVNGYGPESAASNSVTPVLPSYIEDVFATNIYQGNSGTFPVVNNINLSTYGGMLWTKNRSSAYDGQIYNSNTGLTKYIVPSSTSASATTSGMAFNSDGFTLGNNDNSNSSGQNGVGWTFRKQPKFFDVVTYTGDGTDGRSVAHSLGVAPKFIIIKCTSDAGTDWVCGMTGVGTSAYIQINLNSTAAGANRAYDGSGMLSAAPTSTDFKINQYSFFNGSGRTYVAYLFASDAGGFGLTGTDNVISCGSFTTTTSPDFINLGYEPQWVLIKSASSATNWYIFDNMRGIPTGSNDSRLMPNLSSAEQTDADYLNLNATGFTSNFQSIFGDGINLIYIAIRRGPMKVPTDATKVFSPLTSSASTGTALTTGFPLDLQIAKYRASASGPVVTDRLRGVNSTTSTPLVPTLLTTSGSAEDTQSTVSLMVGNTGFQIASNWGGTSSIFWSFGRAPSFMDVVCFTGTGVARTVTHNLQAVPELMIIRRRTPSGGEWYVYSATIGATKTLFLNADYAPSTISGVFNNTAPTSSVFTVGTYAEVNASGSNIVAYLFATCAGVSKVGSYTGNGSTQTINCGFTGGARFVLIKRTDSTGDWYVYDTARGMTTLTDPYLFLNSTAAETATLGSVTTVTTGFALNSTILAAINTNAATYIFLAIA